MKMEKIKDLLSLFRAFSFIGNFIISYIITLTALFVLNIEPEWIKMTLGALALGFLSSASYALNNIYDINIDKINKPFRPLPQKKISIKEAWLYALLLYGIATILAYQIKPFFYFFIIMAVLTIVYSAPPLRIKKKLFTSNIIIGIYRGILITVASWSIVGPITHPWPWLVGTISTVFMIGASVSKDFNDIKGDKKKGIITIPIKFQTTSKKILTPFYILPFLGIPLGIIFKILPFKSAIISLLSIYGAFTVNLFSKKSKLNEKFENNHIGWVHSYIIYFLLYMGLFLVSL